MDPDTEKQLASAFLNAKLDELFYYRQVYKYIKHLEHIYKVGKLENKNKAYYMDVSLKNCTHEMGMIEKEIEKLTGKPIEDSNT